MNDFQQTNKGFEDVTGNELAVQDNTGVTQFDMSIEDKLIADLESRNVSFCSFKPQTDEDKDILFMAMNNPEKRISDCINEIINVRHIFVEVVYLNDEKNNGFKQPCPRVVLIDKDGIGYQAVSLGIYSAVKKMINTYGNPDTWTGAKEFKVLQIKKGTNSLLTFNPVPKKKSAK